MNVEGYLAKMIQAESEQELKGDSHVQKREQWIIHKNSSAVQNW